MPIGILLGDGNPEGLQHVRSLLEREGVEVLGAASESPELVELAVRLRPAVVIVEHSIPQTGALEVAREINNLCPETRVILLSQHASEDYVLAAFRAGIRGYVVKDDASQALARAVQEVSRGQLDLSPSAARGFTDPFVLQVVSKPPETRR